MFTLRTVYRSHYMHRLNLVVSYLLLVVSCGASFRTSSLDGFIYDDYNRVNFFHGTNFVQKSPPWYPEVLTNESNIQQMKMWGFNTVRIGVMWSGVEPSRGCYNETYLGIISSILDDLERHNISAIIDVHQDVLSSYFCLYDGVPTWLVDLSNSSKKEFPWPLAWDGVEPCAPDRPWGENYLAEATGAAFQDLYDNVNGMRDDFALFWGKIAATLRKKNILGYEIINEPWAGNIYSKPSLLLPGIAGSDNLQPFYDTIATSIRQSDPEHIVFYEPVTWGMIFNGTVSGSGLTHVPGGESHKSKSVFSFHYYCWWYTDGGGIQRKTCDDKFGPLVFDQAVDEARQLGGAAMLTEFGQGCDPSNGLIDECETVFNLADKHMLSWTDWYWTGSLMNDWSPSDEAIAVYSRTFAQAIAGIPSKMTFDSQSLQFELCYNLDITITKPTEISVNFEVHYPNGINIRIEGGTLAQGMTSTVDTTNNMVFITLPNASNARHVATTVPYPSTECCVTISPK